MAAVTGKARLVESTRNTRFQPGQSGNPGGRPRTRIITATYNALLPLSKAEVEKIAKSPKSSTVEAMCAQTILKAAKGFTNAVGEVTDRVEGKAQQFLQLETQITQQTADTIIELATTYNLLGDEPSTKPKAERHQIGCNCDLCGMQKRQKADAEIAALQPKMLTQADVALDMREMVQKHEDEERVRQLMHQGKPFPAI